jgi:hypothetical protein
VKQDDPALVPVAVSSKELPFETVNYLKIISGDEYLRPLREYFDTLIIVVDGVELDERGADIVIPVLSLAIESRLLSSVEQIRSFDIVQLKKLAEFRFDDWNPIEPHRKIELRKCRFRSTDATRGADLHVLYDAVAKLRTLHFFCSLH